MATCEFPGDLRAEYSSGDYRNFYDLDVGDVPYVVAVHNEECGASILPREAVPEGDLEPFVNFVERAETHLQGSVEDAAGALMVSIQPLIGDPQTRGLTGGINFFEPSYNDIDSIREGLTNVEAYLTDIVENPRNGWLEAKANELNVSESELRGELEYALANVSEAAVELQNVIETDPFYAVLIGAEEGMRAQGFAEPEIFEALRVGENVNPEQRIEPTAPGILSP